MSIPEFALKLTHNAEDFQIAEVSALEPGALREFAVVNRAFHKPYSPLRNDSYFELSHWEKYKADYIEQRRSPSFHEFRAALVSRENKILAAMNLTNIVRGPMQAAFLGFSVDQRFEGKGLMSVSLKHVLQFAFENLGLNRIMANHLPSNERSSRLLTRLGFEVEGHAKRYLKINGVWEDHILTAKLNTRITT